METSLFLFIGGAGTLTGKIVWDWLSNKKSLTNHNENCYFKKDIETLKSDTQKLKIDVEVIKTNVTWIKNYIESK